MVDLSRLNEPQRAAASHGSGPLLVLAGAGSGKTRVVTYRIANLLAKGIGPKSICALTFTNKAAEEMRERIAHLLEQRDVARQLTIGTFHALGLQILRAERRALGMPGGFAIYDQADQAGVLRDVLRTIHDIGATGERRFDIKAIASRISLAKNSFIAPEAYTPNPSDEYDQITAQVYPKYQASLRALGAFDFDDLICEPVYLWRRDAEARARWQGRYHYVMVDEYQDTNRAQLLFVQELCAQHGNLMVVGDDDQSIYSWRGADPANILRFADMFAGAKIIRLEQNYRSSQTILDAANAVIAHNTDRHGKTLWSAKGRGDVITHAVAPNTEVEAQWVAGEITALVRAGRRYGDMAVLYRSNLQAKLFEEEFRRGNIPYVMYGGQQFFERKEVKDVIAYLRVAVNPRDDLAVRRVLNVPARGIGAATVEKLVTAAHAGHTTLWHVLRHIAGAAELPAEHEDHTNAHGVHIELRGGVRTAITSFVHVVSEAAASLERGIGAGEVARALIEDIELFADIRSGAASNVMAQQRIDNVNGLLGALDRHAGRTPGREALGDYLRALSLSTEDEAPDPGNRVVMTTLHGAKGLEFPVCFMVGLEEETLPHHRALQPQATDVMDADHVADVSEERRLCYVGITRAQTKLYITRVVFRAARGRAAQKTPSRFLLEIPDELLDVIDLGELQRQAVPTDEVKSFFASLADTIE